MFKIEIWKIEAYSLQNNLFLNEEMQINIKKKKMVPPEMASVNISDSSCYIIPEHMFI